MFSFCVGVIIFRVYFGSQLFHLCTFIFFLFSLEISHLQRRNSVIATAVLLPTARVSSQPTHKRTARPNSRQSPVKSRVTTGEHSPSTRTIFAAKDALNLLKIWATVRTNAGKLPVNAEATGPALAPPVVVSIMIQTSIPKIQGVTARIPGIAARIPGLPARIPGLRKNLRRLGP